MKKNPAKQRPKARRTTPLARRALPAQEGRAEAAIHGQRNRALRIKSILVPIDFSAPSKKALTYAIPFAKQFGATLTLLHVVEPLPMPDFAKAYPLTMENDKVLAGCKAQLERLMKQEGIDPKVVEKTLVRQGRSFDEITDAARTLKVDLIIISTHGYTGFKHALLGSTTERVVRHAHCPVLVVRERQHEFV